MGLVDLGVLQALVHDRFAELRSCNYSARADEIVGECSAVHRHYLELRSRMDHVSVQELEEVVSEMAKQQLPEWFKIVRLCPRCRVVIEKSQGCDSFGCICGHRFNFASAPLVFDLRFLQKSLAEMRRGISWETAELRVKSRFRDVEAQQRLRDAAKARKLERKVSQVMAAMSWGLLEVQDLFRRAAAEDQAAWLVIQRARKRSMECPNVAHHSSV